MEFRMLESGYDIKDGLFVIIVLCLSICAYSVMCIIVNTFHLLYLKRVKIKIRKEKVLPDSNEVNGEGICYSRSMDNDNTAYNVYAHKKRLF